MEEPERSPLRLAVGGRKCRRRERLTSRAYCTNVESSASSPRTETRAASTTARTMNMRVRFRLRVLSLQSVNGRLVL